MNKSIIGSAGCSLAIGLLFMGYKIGEKHTYRRIIKYVQSEECRKYCVNEIDKIFDECAKERRTK